VLDLDSAPTRLSSPGVSILKNDAVCWFSALSLLVVIGCDASQSSTDGGTGGTADATGGTTTATGGMKSTGGTTSTGGTAQGTGGSTGGMTVTAMPFPFPQNKKPPNCTLTTVANASTLTQAAYSSWKSAFVVSASPGVRVKRPGGQTPDDTVSEGIAYGMLAAVYMADRALFDGLLAYAKAHSNSHKLMSWHVNSAGGVLDVGSAADADEDMAWALLGASAQWGSSIYLDDGRAIINAMYTTSIASDGRLKPGDNWGSTDDTFPDYFSPAYYRVFAKVANNPTWSGVIIDRNYEILKNSSGSYGLVPDKTTGAYMPPADMKDYRYDACRTPWRIAMDYCFNGEPRALEYLQKIGPFFDKIGAANIVDGYNANGTATGGAHNMAFIGPAGVAGMAGYPKLMDDAFNFGATGGGDQAYYPQSLRVISMLMMSGNFIDFSKL
jgi:endo-1,4-beta-D-glucanase Y